MSQDPQIGTKVNHYRILAPAGEGGMGVVYRAEDLNLGRQVALKFLPPALLHDNEAEQRFLQEARAASALDHPNICTVYEIGEAVGGHPYLAMAWYDGENLRQRLSRGTPTISEAIEIASQVAIGLAAAHQRDVIHRDIKPGNIHLTEDGQVKILDFGLAKILGQGDLTRTGSSMGTPAYMAPENALGEKLDHRADLWSLGALLYETLTGRPPFSGATLPALIFKILGDPPPDLQSLRPEVPSSLAKIVDRLLEKSPADRYSSCEELIEALHNVASDLPFSGTASDEASAVARTADSPRTARPGALHDDEVPTLLTVPFPPADRFESLMRDGFAAVMSRDDHRAVERFTAALKLRPGNAQALFNLARVRLRLADGGPPAEQAPQRQRPPMRPTAVRCS